MSALDEILSELRSGDAYDAKLAEKLATEFAELKEYERLYNLVARDLNSANFRLSEISKFVYQESGLTLHAPDVAKCPACGEALECSTSKCRYYGQVPPRG